MFWIIYSLGIWIPQVNSWSVRLSRWYNMSVKNSYVHNITRSEKKLFYMLSLIIHNTIKKNNNFKSFKQLTTLNLSYNDNLSTFTVVHPTHQIQIEIYSEDGMFWGKKEYLYIYIVGDYNGENITGYQIWTPDRNRDIACKFITTLLFSYGFNLVTSFETFSVKENENITNLIEDLRIINKNKYEMYLKFRLKEFTEYLEEEGF